jgi:hypothetical protein
MCGKTGSTPAFLQAYRKFLKVVKQAGNLYGQCLAYNSIAVAYHYKGDMEESLAYHARHAKIAPDFRVRGSLSVGRVGASWAAMHGPCRSCGVA